MLKLILMAVAAFLMVIVGVLATATALHLPQKATGATPQQVYFRLHLDDELTAKP